MIAQIATNGLVHSLMAVLIIGICVVLIYVAGAWFIRQVSAPPFAMTVWNGFFILVGLIVILNFLLGLDGHPIVVW